MENSKNHNGLGVNKVIKKEAAAVNRGPPLPRQPRVYNIRSSDFRSVVQQLTGASSALPRPRRLNQSRPPPLQALVPPRPAPLALPPAESPFSAYLRFLETSLLHSDGPRRAAASSLHPPSPPPLDLQSPSEFLHLQSPGFLHPQLPLSPSNPFSPLAFQPLPPPSPDVLFPRSPIWKDL
ncbi:protein HAIKU1-like [Musa acuminata AAA Group]|uniref:protein HAIKU1-like n=1 Tax=Musa acuminata AAA Group TaxID=214697 RepID=UPI0031D9ED52